MEIHIRGKEKEKKNRDAAKKANKTDDKKMTWQEIAWLAGKISLGLILLVLFFPLLYLLYRLFLRITFSKAIASELITFTTLLRCTVSIWRDFERDAKNSI